MCTYSKYRDNMRGEVWMTDFGDNVGSEQNGIRPCVILQNDNLTKNSHTLLVLPVTKARKKLHSTQATVQLKEISQALCEQTRVIDKDRMLYRQCKLSKDEMKKIEKKLAFTLGLHII